MKMMQGVDSRLRTAPGKMLCNGLRHKDLGPSGCIHQRHALPQSSGQGR